MRVSSAGLSAFVGMMALVGCGSNSNNNGGMDMAKPMNPFTPVPECMGASAVPFAGSRQLLVSSLQLADFGVGFDLNGDGMVDNKLSLLGGLANGPLKDTFTTTRDVAIALEMFDYEGASDDTCVKTNFYLASVNKDRDGDKKNDSPDQSDCLDNDPMVPRAEVPGNSLDDDCDGYADNMVVGSKPTSNTVADQDGDGVTIAMGDCDDRSDSAVVALAKSRYPGATEICGNGIDEDCDGIPDNGPACTPFGNNNLSIDVSAQSFKDPMATPLVPFVTFNAGQVKANAFTDGPSLFRVDLPLLDTPVSLVLTGARLGGTLREDTAKKLTYLDNGMLGGVLSAFSLAQITGIDAASVISKDQSLLDAIFGGGAVAQIIGLETDAAGHYLPDIDVDGDGLETFWAETQPPSGQSVRIDTCKDGDGTVVKSTPTAPCALAKDAAGNYRFPDGLSIALKLAAVPAKLNTTLVK